MDMTEYLRAIAAFSIVLALMWGLALTLRYLNSRRTNLPGLAPKRLSILEIKQLDARNRLILLGHDDTEHLVILGHDSQTLLSSTPRKSKQGSPKQDSAA